MFQNALVLGFLAGGFVVQADVLKSDRNMASNCEQHFHLFRRSGAVR